MESQREKRSSSLFDRFAQKLQQTATDIFNRDSDQLEKTMKSTAVHSAKAKDFQKRQSFQHYDDDYEYQRNGRAQSLFSMSSRNPIQNEDSFQRNVVLPQIIRSQISRDVPEDQRRSYHQGAYKGANKEFKRMPSPILESDLPLIQTVPDYQIFSFNQQEEQQSSLLKTLSSLGNALSKNIQSCKSCLSKQSCKCEIFAQSPRDRKERHPEIQAMQFQKASQFEMSVNADVLKLKKDLLLKKSKDNEKNFEQIDQSFKIELTKFEKERAQLESLKLHKMSQYLQRRETKAQELKSGYDKLNERVEDEYYLNEDTLKVIGQEPLSNSFFEMHPHLIYQESSDNCIQEGQNLPEQTGFIEQVKIIYSFNYDQLKLRQMNGSDFSRPVINKLKLQSQILKVSYGENLELRQKYLMIVTKDQVIVYLLTSNLILSDPLCVIKHGIESGNCQIFYSSSSKRIFYSTNSAQLKDLPIQQQQPTQQSSWTLFSCRDNSAKRKAQSVDIRVSRDSENSQSNVGKASSMLNSLYEFFRNPVNPTHEVSQICEHEGTNSIFTVVNHLIYHSQSYIQVYWMGPLGNKLEAQFRIEMKDIYETILKQNGKRANQIEYEALDDIDVQKIWISKTNYEALDESYLNILLSNGHIITLMLNLREIVLTDDEKELMNNPSIKVKKFTLSSNRSDHKLVSYKFIPIQTIISEYQNLFGEQISMSPFRSNENLISQTGQQYFWKPLMAEPINLSSKINLFLKNNYLKIIDHAHIKESGIDFFLVKLSYEEQKNDYVEKEEDQVMDGQGNQQVVLSDYFVISIQPNYRRKRGMRHTQDLVSITKLYSNSGRPAQIVLLSASASNKAHDSLRFGILNAQGNIESYILQGQKDTVASYLKLLNLSSTQIQSQNILFSQNCYEQDFDTFLSGQDPLLTLDILLRIIFSKDQESFYESSLIPFFYNNIASIISKEIAGQQTQTEKYFIYQKVSEQFRSTLVNYRHTEHRLAMFFSHEIKNKAIEFFLELSNPLKLANFDTLVLKNENYAKVFLGSLDNQYSSNSYDQLSKIVPLNYLRAIELKQAENPVSSRLQSLYEFFYHQMKKLMDQKIFSKLRKSLGDKKYTVIAKVSPADLDNTRDMIFYVLNFVKKYQLALADFEIDSDHLQAEATYQEIKKDVVAFLTLLERFYDGLLLLSQILKSDNLSQILSDCFNGKNEQKALVKISIKEYLELGLQQPDICILVQNFITRQLDCKEFQNMSQIETHIQKCSNSILYDSALAIMMGKKFIQEARYIEIKNIQPSKSRMKDVLPDFTSKAKPEQEWIESFRRLGFQLMLRYARYLNLPAALADLSQAQMWEESVLLMVKYYEQVDMVKIIYSHSSGSSRQRLGSESSINDQTFENPNEGSMNLGIRKDENCVHLNWVKNISEAIKENQVKLSIQSKEQCILILSEMVEEICKSQIKVGSNQKMMDDLKEHIETQTVSRFKVILEFQDYLQQERNIGRIQDLIFKLFSKLMSSSKREFHFQLYQILFDNKKLETIYSLPESNNPYFIEFLNHINSPFDLAMSGSAVEDRIEAVGRNQSLEQESKINCKILGDKVQELSKAKLYYKLYNDVMSYICLNSWDKSSQANTKKENVMDIKDRIRFAHKAEGALAQHQDELKRGGAYATSFQQDKNLSPIITLEEVKRFDTLKDFFVIKSRLLEKVEFKIKKLTKNLDNIIENQESTKSSGNFVKSIFGKVLPLGKDLPQKDEIEEEEKDIQEKKVHQLELSLDDLYQMKNQLKYRVMNPNDTYQMAIQLKCWTDFLRLIQLNEMRDILGFTSSSASSQIIFGIQRAQSFEQSEIRKINEDVISDIQSRVDFMYDQLLSKYYNLPKLNQMISKSMAFSKFKSTLSDLSKFANLKDIQDALPKISQGTSQRSIPSFLLGGSSQASVASQQSKVNLFPLKLIIQRIEQVGIEYMLLKRTDENLRYFNEMNKNVDLQRYFRWDPLWYIVAFPQILRDKSQHQGFIFAKMFEVLTSDKDIKVSHQKNRTIMSELIPEAYLSIALLIILWHKHIIDLKQSLSSSYVNESYARERELFLSYRGQMTESISRLLSSVSDELLFPKPYSDGIKDIAAKIQQKISSI